MSLPMHQRRTSSRERNTLSSHGHFSTNDDTGSAMYGRSNSASSYNPSDLESGRRGGSMSARETNASIMEQQNNDRISELSDQVAQLKSLTLDINGEVKEQNSLLDDMGDGFSSTRDLLAGSLRRMGHMLESGGARHMCYMVGFVVIVMVFLYWLMSYKGTSGA